MADGKGIKTSKKKEKDSRSAIAFADHDAGYVCTGQRTKRASEIPTVPHAEF